MITTLKRSSTVWLLTFCLLSKAQGQTAPKLGAVTGTPIRNIKLRLDKADVNEHVIELSRAEDTNLLVDATHLPTPSPDELLTEETTDSFGNYLLFLAYQRHLAWDKVGEGSNGRGTFIMWPQEKLTFVAREVLDDAVPWINKDISALEWQPVKQLAVVTPDANQTQAELHQNAYQQETLYFTHANDDGRPAKRAEEVGSQLMSYLQRTYGWNGTLNGFKKDIVVAELPPALRDNLLARLQGQIFHPRRIASSKLWFNRENFAQNSYMWLTTSPRTKGSQSFQVDSYGENGIHDGIGMRWAPSVQSPVRRMGVPSEDARPARGFVRVEFTSPTSALFGSNPLLLAAVDAQTVTPGLLAPPLTNGEPATLPLAHTAEDENLNHKVSFQVKSKLLSEVLQTLAQQSGATLSLSEGISAQTLLTGRVHDLALGEMMSALEHLYSAIWKKTGENIYQLCPSNLSPAQTALNRLGNLTWYRFYERTFGDPERPNFVVPAPVFWRETIAPYVTSLKQLHPKWPQERGMSISVLPDDVQNALLDALQEQISDVIVRTFQPATLDNLRQAVLTIDATLPLIADQNVNGTAIGNLKGHELGLARLTAPGYTTLDFSLPVLAKFAAHPQKANGTAGDNKQQ